jgi:hypothetical protein
MSEASEDESDLCSDEDDDRQLVREGKTLLERLDALKNSGEASA